ncbi:GH10843 [Drosophila grimshawi]|uniref:GH10843 n=1 Tax=Drosophila grimshawi TaxID=7222 RepID=B4JAK3_DROGR|nr:GH10843 [Drosophila grimshawi]
MVFYEALCPDSKYFITKQLLPAYKNAAPIMEVQLVPYGKCAKQHNFENIDLIQKCFDSNHGSELMKLNGDATSALRPQVTFIPTITLDGSQGRQASILKDLLGEICKVAAGMDQAEKICKH